MSRFFEVCIQPSSGGFGEYETQPINGEAWADEGTLLMAMEQNVREQGGALIELGAADNDWGAGDLIECRSADGWSLHAPWASDEKIANGDEPALTDGEGDITAANRAAAWAVLSKRFDIRGAIRNEPARVFAVVRDDGQCAYVGITSVA